MRRYSLVSGDAGGQLRVGNFPAPSAEWSTVSCDPEGPTSGHWSAILGDGNCENAGPFVKSLLSRPLALANRRLRPYSMYFNWEWT